MERVDFLSEDMSGFAVNFYSWVAFAVQFYFYELLAGYE